MAQHTKSSEEKRLLLLQLRFEEMASKQDALSDQLTRIENLLTHHEVHDIDLINDVHKSLADLVVSVSTKVDDLVSSIRGK